MITISPIGNPTQINQTHFKAATPKQLEIIKATNQNTQKTPFKQFFSKFINETLLPIFDKKAREVKKLNKELAEYTKDIEYKKSALMALLEREYSVVDIILLKATIKQYEQHIQCLKEQIAKLKK